MRSGGATVAPKTNSTLGHFGRFTVVPLKAGGSRLLRAQPGQIVCQLEARQKAALSEQLAAASMSDSRRCLRFIHRGQPERPLNQISSGKNLSCVALEQQTQLTE